MKTYDVTALGELLVDFTEHGVSTQGNPLYEANPGGAPCNVLSMLQKLGRKTAFIGKIGKDPLGAMLREVVEKQGIAVQNLMTDSKTPTTLAFVHTASDGERSFSFYRNPGADQMLKKQEIDTALLHNTRLFHFGSLSMTAPESEAATRLAVETAKRAGALISFDPNLRIALWEGPEMAKEKISYGISQCQILKISDDELSFFTGTKDMDKGVAQIQEQYHTPMICTTMGKRGSRVYYAQMCVECGPFLNEKTVETTGAGDTFMACVLHWILTYGLEGLDQQRLLEMLEFANAASSIITTRKGALNVMPEECDVWSFLQQRKKSIIGIN